MFPWNIAKSAESVFSRWAVKRVCKFLLKKKLGKLILGDIDLDQLDVQLSDGTLQLKDLALNVDYLNEKFGVAASVIIKEGSIGSLMVKMPWKCKGCQVEADELELVVAPSSGSLTSGANGASTSTQDATSTHRGSQKLGHDMVENAAKSVSIDVHEGVKTIAKMVKWFLTSFHVKIRRLIVACDPCTDKDQNEGVFRTSLVLRMSEIECGTCVSEDPISNGDARIENFLGISRLTNFVKFQGARVELLHMDNLDNETFTPYPSENPFGDLLMGGCRSKATTPIMTGRGGSFSGSLSLSIPWKHGSLDIRKVDADLSIDPIEIRLQPATIKWFILSWNIFSTISRRCTPASVSSMIPPDGAIPVHESIAGSFATSSLQPVPETSLPGLNFIHDWVPSSVTENQGGMDDVDFEASVEQFFECFDGMRSFQSALGSSGMWNWTSSVFTAITAASSLASGSVHVPSEQQHIQTNLKASVAGISGLLFFRDGADQLHDCASVNYLGADIRDIYMSVQICPQKTRLEGKVNNIEVAEYMSYGRNIKGSDSLRRNPDIEYQNNRIRSLQSNVVSALPPFAASFENAEAECYGGLLSDGFLTQSKDCTVKIVLLRARGVTQCQFTVDSQSSDGSSAGVISLSLILPAIISWLNFDLIDKLIKLLVEITESVEKIRETDLMPTPACDEKHDNMPNRDEERSCGLCITTVSGNISISSARVILCFPLGRGKQAVFNSLWEEFIVLDVASLPVEKERMFDETGRYAGGMPSPSATRSLRFVAGDVTIYLVASGLRDGEFRDSSKLRGGFSACKVLSASSSTPCLSVVSMLWPKCPTSGPLIAEKVKHLAMLEESSWANRRTEDHEFAAVTPAKDLEDVYCQTKKDVILSSAFCLHVKLVPVTVHLEASQYNKLLDFLEQAKVVISSKSCDGKDGSKRYSVSQTSILMECDYVEISIRPWILENIRGSLQSELPGSWQYLKLGIQKFSLLAGSNLGNLQGADLFWVAHHEGKLWGSITSSPDQMLLISCSNSARKRGNGGGSNALSSRLAGLDIIHFWDPDKFESYLSISVRCATIVAVGGRWDWVGVASSFFISSSSKTEEVDDNSLQKGKSTIPCGSSFILNLVDIGLSYEPHFKKTGFLGEGLGRASSFSKGQTRVACLLAATSFKLSNISLADSIDSDYKIRVQDLGLLLSLAPKSERPDGIYSVGYLREIDYVKVAQGALVEATLRTNCGNGLNWEVECSKSHLYVETCSDTTFGLIRLAAQLQQLFAPDVEESAVHLQTRWNNVQQAQRMDDVDAKSGIFNLDSPVFRTHDSSAAAVNENEVAGLMDEISEDAFCIDGNTVIQPDSLESRPDMLLAGIFHGTPETCSLDHSLEELTSAIISESSPTSFPDKEYFPELIENYCLSDLRPLSDIYLVREPRKQLTPGDVGIGRGNNGWYGDGSLRILEDHISETSENGVSQISESMALEYDFLKIDNLGDAVGRLIFKNINVRWRMYSGSDWEVSRKESSGNFSGRDTAGCLELELSEMECQYDVFPVGGLCLSKLSLSVQDFNLCDQSKVAPWKLVLSFYNSRDHPRDSASKAFRLDLEAVRPDPETPLEEYRLRISFLPLLLHLHQSQLDFLISFFGGENSEHPHCDLESSSSSTSFPANGDDIFGLHIVGEALLPYFQKFDIWPTTVRIDYRPHNVDLTALLDGKFAELVNLIPWKGVELQLKHVHATGIYGWAKVCERILSEWLEDISQNQIRSVLRGVPTIKSLFTLAEAGRKLIALPVESYRKDRKVLKGVQRGTISFFRCLSLEAVAFGVHLAAGAHDILLQAECMLTSGPSLSLPRSKTKSNVKLNQPKNAKEGIQQAYDSISGGLGKSASALIRSPLKKYQRGASAGSALATAVRGVPTAAIAPASGCVNAVHCTLLGFRNSLDPERKKESVEKYLGPDQRHQN